MMNRQEANELYPIIKAFAEGKIIECRTKPSVMRKSLQDLNRWVETKCLSFKSNLEYRIKPEPEYHPSKNQLSIKDGDIMMTMDRRAFITNGIIDSDGYPCAYCGINLHHNFTINTPIHVWTSSSYIPASKEAKKELFNKMAEAGYKWNAKNLKLEKIKLTYRPFANKEECWQEMLKHQPFGWVKYQCDFFQIIHVDDNSVSYGSACGVILHSKFEDIFKNSTFVDGTPFGIKEEY